MSHVQTSRANYVPGGSASTLVSGAGRLLAILAQSNSGALQTIIFYDNTTEGGNILLELSLAAGRQAEILWPHGREPVFDTGLTVFTPDDVAIHCTTLAL